MATPHTVAVTLSSGTDVDVFDRYTITLDMMRAGNPWTVSMWRSISGAREASWEVLRREVKLGENITLSVDGAAQITGRIETLRTAAPDDKGGATMVISGRDLGGMAMTWDADPTVRLKGLALSDALTALFTPFGVSVLITDAAAARLVQSGTNRTSLGRPSRPHATHTTRPHSPSRGVHAAHARRRAQPIDQSHPRAGEKAWALAEEMCRRVGFLMWVAPSAAGGLAVVVDVPAFSTADVFTFGRRIENGVATGNILKGAESFSIKEVPSEVNVYTGTTRGDLVSNRSRSQTFNVGVETAAVNRGFLASPMPAQVRHIKSARSRTLAASAKEGERVVAEAMAGFRRCELTVQGHGQTVAGVDRLYALNTMARVRDDLCTSPDGAPLDESMLITSVTFEGGRQTGTTTTMVLVPKDSISVIPQE